MTTDHQPTSALVELGDALEHAWAADLTHPLTTRPSFWRRKAVALPTAALLLVGGAGATAAAIHLLTPTQVETGVTNTAMIFLGTTARCTTTDQVTFDCTLDSTPKGEPGVAIIKGAKYEFAVDHKVAGGCEALDATGLRWTCYAGQAAVDHGIIGQDFLGETIPDGVHPVG